MLQGRAGLELVTAMFAIARSVGWVAHWCEMVNDPEQRLGRPRQLYIGPGRRDYVERSQRSGKS